MSNLEKFCENYKLIQESKQEEFERLVNKMLNVNYLTKEKEEDRQDYYFIINNFDCFKSYLALAGIELKHYQLQEAIVLVNPYLKKESLKRIQSIILLIIRLLYNQKFNEISLESKILITVSDIQDKYEQIMVANGRINKTELEDSLKLFKKYNLTNYKNSDLFIDDCVITIYSTIQFALPIENIEEIVKKIKSYGKQVEDEEVSED